MHNLWNCFHYAVHCDNNILFCFTLIIYLQIVHCAFSLGIWGKQVFLFATFCNFSTSTELIEIYKKREKELLILIDGKKEKAEKEKTTHLRTVSRRRRAGRERICRERDGKIKVEWRHWGTAAEVCGLLNSYLIELVKLWSLWHWQTTGKQREWRKEQKQADQWESKWRRNCLFSYKIELFCPLYVITGSATVKVAAERLLFLLRIKLKLPLYFTH